MIDAYLESVLLAACPGFRDEWDAIRRTHQGTGGPGEDELFTHVRLHVVGLLTAGRVAEFARFARAMERLLGEADPLLHDLLRDQLVRPLARETAEATVASALVAPHVGERMRAMWH